VLLSAAKIIERYEEPPGASTSGFVSSVAPGEAKPMLV
jgi:hypothetical protein